MDKLAIAGMLSNYIIATEPMDPGGPNDPEITNQDLATSWLQAHGFDRVEWAQADDDILLCLLWYREGEKLKEFIIEFAGHDSLIVTIFEKTDEAIL